MSPVDICNLALARLGDMANVISIDPPEGSSQAQHCAMFYPIARDSMLESHNWSFTINTDELALVAENVNGWSFAYARPSECMRVIEVIQNNAQSQPSTIYSNTINTSKKENYACESYLGSPVIYTNIDTAMLRYIKRETDTNKYSVLFCDALSWLLASHLAGSIIKGNEGIQVSNAMFRNYQVVSAQAKHADASQDNDFKEHLPDWVRYR